MSVSRAGMATGIGLAGLAGFAIGAVAQTNAPSTSQAVQQQIPSREEVTPPLPAPAPQSGVSVDSDGAIRQPACPFEASPIRLSLKHVSFTRPDGSPLQAPIAQSLAGLDAPSGDQSIRVVCELRDRANAALRRDGWVASVQIPAQSIGTGELVLHVITARITEIRVRGDPGPYRRVLAARIAQLQALDPLNERDAERALLLAGDIPGLDVRLSLRPAGTKPGDVIGDLNIVFRRFAVLGNAQNYNSRTLGRESAYVRGEIYGLTGLADVTYVGASVTPNFRDQTIAQVGHIMGLDSAGTTFGARFTYAWSRPNLGALDLRTDTLITGFDLVRPIVRSLHTNLRGAGGFDYVDQRSTVGSGGTQVPLNLDKLRVVYARLGGDAGNRRPDGVPIYAVRGDIELRKGLAIFGATPVGAVFTGGALPSRIDGDSRAFVVRGDFDGTLGLGRIFSLGGSVRAQWANAPLLNYEEFSLGNLTIGRGYDPGSNSGDRAVGGRGELRAAIPGIRNVGAEVFGFYDYVWLTNLDQNSTETNRHFRSFGGGVRVTLANRLLVEAMYAHPQDRALTIDKGPPPDRLLVSLTVQFRGRAR